MTTLTHLKLGLAAAGLLVWGYGYRVDDVRARWIGIALIAVAAVLRFVRSGPKVDDTAT